MAAFWSLRGLSLGQLAKRTCLRSWNDEVFGQSARLAFYFFFAVFPVLLLLLMCFSNSAMGGPWRDALREGFAQVLPPDSAVLMGKTIEQLNARISVGMGAAFAGLSAAWGALNGIWAIVTGLNIAYEVKEARPWWRVMLIIVGLTLALCVAGLLALVAILFANRWDTAAAQPFQAAGHVEFVWRAIPWAVAIVSLLFSFALIYRFGPNLKDCRWQWSNPGAVLAVILWVSSTLLLRVYQEHFHSTRRIYGGLNAVAMLLFWLYLTGAAVFIGGEANSEIEKAASEAGHSDVRDESERRSGGDRSKQ